MRVAASGGSLCSSSSSISGKGGARKKFYSGSDASDEPVAARIDAGDVWISVEGLEDDNDDNQGLETPDA